MARGWQQRLAALALLLLLHSAAAASRLAQYGRRHERPRSSLKREVEQDEGLQELRVSPRKRLRGAGMRDGGISTHSQAMHERRAMRRRAAGEKVLAAVAEDAPPKKKKKKKKKKMSKEDMIKAAAAAQAAAKAALEQGLTHEDAAKAADALLKEKGATEIADGLMSAEDVEKAEGRPAPFKGKGEADEPPARKGKKKKKKKGAAVAPADEAAPAAEGEGAAEEASAEAAEPPKKKKKKKAAAEETAAAEPAVAEGGAEEGGDAAADVAPAETPKAKKKKKKKAKAAPAAGAEETVSEASRKLAAAGRMTPPSEDGEEDEFEGTDEEDLLEEEEVEEADVFAEGASAKVAGKGAPGVPVAARAPRGAPGLAHAPKLAPQPLQQAAPAAQRELPALQARRMRRADAIDAAAGAHAFAAGNPGVEVSAEMLGQLLRASAEAVARDAASFVQAIAGRRAAPAAAFLHQAAAAPPPLSTHEQAAAQWQIKHAAGNRAAPEQAHAKPPALAKIVVRQSRDAANVELAVAEAAHQLPPWFKNASVAGMEKAAKAGAAGRHGGKVGAAKPQASSEARWLDSHLRHVAEVKEGPYDVILYGDDIVEAWRGTFMGQTYHSFNDIPALWEEIFVAHRPYKALAAGIAGDGTEQLLWRLQNGELPPAARAPKVVVLACGTNGKGMSGECALADANATAAQMAAAVRHVRRCLPGARLVLQAVLPKGDYWPNRCSAAIDSFNGVLQELAEGDPLMHYADFGAAFLSHLASNAWGTKDSAPVRQEINEAFMPDAQHPSAAGMRVLAQSLEPLIARLVAEAATDGAAAARKGSTVSSV